MDTEEEIAHLKKRVDKLESGIKALVGFVTQTVLNPASVGGPEIRADMQQVRDALLSQMPELQSELREAP